MIPELINSIQIPYNVYAQVNILQLASSDFISAVEDIESTTANINKDNYRELYNQRSAKAIYYINKFNTRTFLTYDVALGDILRNPYHANIETWRELYLLERSVPPRTLNNFTWYERLIIFYNTYLQEKHVVDHILAPNNKKFYWVKGNSENPIYHDRLVMGAGKFGADLYFYDDTVNGSVTSKMIKTECKYNNKGSFSNGINYYFTNFNYGAPYLAMYQPDEECVYLVNLKTKSVISKTPGMPDGLIKL